MKKEDLKTVEEILKAVPIYQDAIQPAAKELGNSLTTIAKTVSIALTPIKLLVWGYDKIEDFLTQRLSEKLKDVPEENIITPPTNVAGPAIEALRFAGHDKTLRELYANLLATAMNKNTTYKAHPGYVEIIKNLTPDEARLLTFMPKLDSIALIDIRAKRDEVGFTPILSNYTNLNADLKIESEIRISVYISNLCRLGILEIPSGIFLIDEKYYEILENSELVLLIKEEAIKYNRIIEFDRRLLRLTAYGKDFFDCVVMNQ